MDPPPPIATNTEPASELPSSLRHPASLSSQTVPLRRAIVLAYCTVIILALPVWWYTTSIQRLSLPSSRVLQLAQSHLELPISICVETSDSGLTDSIRRALSRHISRDSGRWKGLVVDVEGKVACGASVAPQYVTYRKFSAGESDKNDLYTIIFTAGPSVIQGRRLYTPLKEPNCELWMSGYYEPSFTIT